MDDETGALLEIGLEEIGVLLGCGALLEGAGVLLLGCTLEGAGVLLLGAGTLLGSELIELDGLLDGAGTLLSYVLEERSEDCSLLDP